VIVADRVTAAVSPVAALAGLMIGLLVLKLNRDPGVGSPTEEAVSPEPGAESTSVPDNDPLVADVARILQFARANGQQLSQRALAERLRSRGQRFPNAQVRVIFEQADSRDLDRLAG
jgi:hypothetical protein